MNAITKNQAAGIRLIGWCHLFIGGVTLAIGIAFAIRSYLFLETAVEVQATVTANRSYRSANSRADTYSPTFRYTAHDGKQHTVAFLHQSTEYNYPVGDDVTALYDPGNPQDLRVASLFSLWGIAMISGGIGLLACIVSLGCFVAARKVVERHEQRIAQDQ